MNDYVDIFVSVEEYELLNLFAITYSNVWSNPKLIRSLTTPS